MGYFSTMPDLRAGANIPRKCKIKSFDVNVMLKYLSNLSYLLSL